MYHTCMGHRQKLIAMLHRTELSMRELASAALADKDYGAASLIADVTASFAQLAQSITGPSRRQASRVKGRQRADVSNTGCGEKQLSGQTGAESAGFPRFERDGHKLVKVGWSDRDSCSYEHRASRAVVNEFCGALAGHALREATFSMKDFTDLKGEEGEAIPTYQAYVVLAWLKSIGLVERVGKKEYAVRGDAISPETIDRCWLNLVRHRPRLNGGGAPDEEQ